MQGIEKKERAGTPVSMIHFNPGQPPAMALVGDNDFVIAGFEGNNNNHVELIEQMLVHREKKDANAATGNLKAELNKIPAKAVGFLVGTLPAEPRNHFQQMMGAFPKKVSGYMERIPTGLDLVLEGGLDNANEAKTFIQSAGKLRTDALNALQNNLQNAPPELNVNALRNLLNSMQFEPKGANVHMRMLVADDALMTVPYFFLGRPEPCRYRRHRPNKIGRMAEGGRLMSALAKRLLTPQEYLAQERRAEFRSEYLRGEVFPMAGSSPSEFRSPRFTEGFRSQIEPSPKDENA